MKGSKSKTFYLLQRADHCRQLILLKSECVRKGGGREIERERWNERDTERKGKGGGEIYMLTLMRP